MPRTGDGFGSSRAAHGATTADPTWSQWSCAKASGRTETSVSRRDRELCCAAAFFGPPAAQVVTNGATNDPRRRHHVEAVEQAEPAQKPFGEHGIAFGGAEELVEQLADRLVPARCGAAGLLQGVVADRVHRPHRKRGLGGGSIEFAG